MAKTKKIKPPMGRKLSNEAVVTNWLVDLIESDKLYETILGKESIEEVNLAINDSHVIPKFSIDYASRLASARSSKFVLEQLRNLEIVSIDRSISLDKGEVLRPDIIAYNPESRVVILFEVKRDKGPERQAVSELAGYEHELQNFFPFLSNMDICFVLVAKDWSDLMSHGLAGFTTWAGKQCLALSLDYDAVPRELRCKIVEAWSLTGSTSIPEDALQCYDLVLYDKDEQESTSTDVGVPRLVQTAIDMIARSGDRMRSHGFLLLWRDISPSPLHWAITLCTFDYGVFAAKSSANERSKVSKISSYFLEDKDISSGSMPKGGYEISRASIDLLSEDYDVKIENHATWKQKVRTHRLRSEPVIYEFWGAAGDFARDFISQQSVRKILLTFLRNSKLDWRDPIVAVPLIEYMADRPPFAEGKVLSRDLLEAGITLGSLATTCANINTPLQDSEESSNEEALTLYSTRFRWILPEAVLLMAELAQLSLSYEDLEPPPPLTNDFTKVEDHIEKIVAWVHEDLIGDDHEVHLNSFIMGLSLGAAYEYFSQSPTTAIAPKELEQASNNAIHFCEKTVLTLMSRMEDNEIGDRARDEANDYLQQLAAFHPHDFEKNGIRTLLENLPFSELLCTLRLCATAVDSFLNPVHHTLRPLAIANVDMTAIKDGIATIFKRGDKRPAVNIDSSGRFGIGHLPEEGRIFPELTSTDDEVYFADYRPGFAMITKATWAEVAERLSAGHK